MAEFTEEQWDALLGVLLTSPFLLAEDVILERQAVKRLIEPEEVAAVVELLLGPEGGAFTGAAVPMDLGWTAR